MNRREYSWDWMTGDRSRIVRVPEGRIRLLTDDLTMAQRLFRCPGLDDCGDEEYGPPPVKRPSGERRDPAAGRALRCREMMSPDLIGFWDRDEARRTHAKYKRGRRVDRQPRSVVPNYVWQWLAALYPTPPRTAILTF